MKKNKLISAALSALIVISSFGNVFAAETEKVTVTVDDRLVHFEDQEPVIVGDGHTLIPLRGVLEAMGASVEWDGEERSVFVKSKDNITRLKLYIDNPVMTQYTLKTITQMDSKEVELTTPPVIMNDRTMIPLRVVSENIGAVVDWDGETRRITISTKEYQNYIASSTPTVDEDSQEAPKYNPKDNLPYYYIDAEEKDGVVTVSVNLANTDKLQEGAVLAGGTVGLYYDSTKLTALNQSVYVDGNQINSILSASNPEFLEDSIKYVFVIMPGSNTSPISDGAVAKLTFEVVDDTETEISLSNRVVTRLGGDTTCLIQLGEDSYANLEDADQIFIDTTPVVINAD